MRNTMIVMLALLLGCEDGGSNDGGDPPLGEGDLLPVDAEHVFMSSEGFVCLYVELDDFIGGDLRFGSESVRAGNGKPGTYCASFGPGRRSDGELWVDLDDGRRSEGVACVTPAWIDDAVPAEVRPGEILTLRGGNFGTMYPEGFGVLPGFRASRWTDDEIDVFLPVSTPDRIELRVTKSDGSEDYAPGNEVLSSEAVEVGLTPVLFSGCRVTPGVRCTLLGAALPISHPESGTGGSVQIGSMEVVDYVSGVNELGFSMPDLPPGVHDITITNRAGHPVTGEVEILGWTRAELGQLSTNTDLGAVEREGTIHAAPGGAVAVFQGTSFKYNDTDRDFDIGGHGFSIRAFGPLVEGGGRAGTPFETQDVPYEVGTAALDVETGAPRIAAAEDRVFFADRVSGGPPLDVAAGTTTWSGNPAESSVSPPPEAEAGRVSGLVHAAGRVWMAVQDDGDLVTELYRFAPGAGFVRESSFPGRSVLHAAGEALYLAGGEPEFTGEVHQIRMVEEQPGEPLVLTARTLPPLPGEVPVARQSLFAGADDGALLAGVIGSSGTLDVLRFDLDAEQWEPVATVPDSVPGVPTGAALLENPASLGVLDLEDMDGRVYLLTEQAEGGRNLVRVFHLGADGWLQTREELASWSPLARLCIGPWEDAGAACPEDAGRDGCPGDACARDHHSWVPRPGSGRRARMHAQDGDLWVLYEVRYKDSEYLGDLGEDRLFLARLSSPPVD